MGLRRGGWFESWQSSGNEWGGKEEPGVTAANWMWHDGENSGWEGCVGGPEVS